MTLDSCVSLAQPIFFNIAEMLWTYPNTMIYKKITLFCAALTLFAACNNVPKVAELQTKPEDAAKAFFEALSEKNIEKAQALGTENTKRQVHLLGIYFNMSSDKDIADKKKELNLDLQFKSITCAENQGKMICKICCNGEGAEADIEMVQQDGKWFVQHDFGIKEEQKEELK